MCNFKSGDAIAVLRLDNGTKDIEGIYLRKPRGLEEPGKCLVHVPTMQLDLFIEHDRIVSKDAWEKQVRDEWMEKIGLKGRFD